MADLRRFVTVQAAQAVMRELYMPKERWILRGGCFTLSLAIPALDKAFDLIVDRTNRSARSEMEHSPIADGSWMSHTRARRTTDGESFAITIIFNREEVSKMEAPAEVRVSSELERILLEEFAGDQERELEDLLRQKNTGSEE